MRLFITAHICAMLISCTALIVATSLTFEGDLLLVWLNVIFVLAILWLALLVILSLKNFKYKPNIHGE